MAIHDGWLVKRATVQAVDRGNVVGGNFRGENVQDAACRVSNAEGLIEASVIGVH